MYLEPRIVSRYYAYLYFLCIFRSSFEAEAQILSAISDPNIARVVGANLDTEPRFMVCEFSELGDLNQFLQDHVAETSLSHSSAVNTLRSEQTFKAGRGR